MKIIWILVNCNSITEAKKIGTALLKKRLVSCFDIFERAGAWYFWPPKSGKIETSRGALLILETLPAKVKKIGSEVRRLHSDALPFIGTIEIGTINSRYLRWMKGEMRK
ncbi:MAG: hypothetical protein A3B30_02800 [Candidatus Komeilibacteria bacterium RIFCSPLOWO2_01_FULL_52_15]|uniref:Divalent-cation tolerance protein CutA n=2 Tax=Candidatus Komeiliibacteriota TaxID=1817908 RepID=A0A1G2BNE8_9BACT|nr:MAG: hypothetical protein A2677_02125 [Candidatus Komeilibacteria bacterium RIFCSPHIGHO2_01_FULL_52_14]OGY90664.1 MAG: hypothetical protein A3B30_02800 [Candidatus Komeilibacteria bacterium RIFCSPLOWO2_01_FULL_52_15]